MTRRPLALAALTLPTLLVAAYAGWLGVTRESQPALRIAITGYDPRDLLRGHYLEFRLDLPEADELACACLLPVDHDALRPAAVRSQCTPPPRDCRHPIAAPRQPFRYYAAEERALALQDELARNPGSASVLVHFHGDGTVSFSEVETGSR
jgi:hypothetical protein